MRANGLKAEFRDLLQAEIIDRPGEQVADRAAAQYFVDHVAAQQIEHGRSGQASRAIHFDDVDSCRAFVAAANIRRQQVFVFPDFPVQHFIAGVPGQRRDDIAARDVIRLPGVAVRPGADRARVLLRQPLQGFERYKRVITGRCRARLSNPGQIPGGGINRFQ